MTQKIPGNSLKEESYLLAKVLRISLDIFQTFLLFHTFYKLFPFDDIKLFGTDSFEKFQLCKYFLENVFGDMESIGKIREEFLTR